MTAAVCSVKAPKGAFAGLVSLSTSDLGKNFLRNEEKKALEKKLDAFEVDAVQSRLARLRKNVGASARLIDTNFKAGMRKERVIMVTLTYAGNNDDWEPRHISKFIKNARDWCKRRGLSFKYVWVAELQMRGVIHYHVAIWLPRHVTLPKPDKRGWWLWGMTNITVARKAVPYLMKYLSKDTSKTFGTFPKGSRIYGVGGLGDVRCVRRWLNYPSFIKCLADVNEKWVRVVGGGWADPAGELFKSEFEYCYVNGKACLRRVFSHPKLIQPWGAFSWLKEVH